jgi:3,4-dihydroxy 2-butanone 4-phosphate synthase/GTP cyclohydrolase II
MANRPKLLKVAGSNNPEVIHSFASANASTPLKLNKIEEIIDDIRLGKMVVLMDDEDRENEGDLVMAAECVTAEHINFMARHARGLICMPMSREHSERLGLRLMVERNASGFGTKFTTSIEAATGVTTGISAADRARTVQVAASPGATETDIVQPGHIFPLIAETGGVLVRAGHTESACDLARFAGFGETGVICEVMNDDGSMARRPDLEIFAQKHGLKIGTVADLVHYRVVHESTVEQLGSQSLQTDFGEFRLHSFRDRIKGDVHLALVCGVLDPNKPILARVQHGFSIRDLLGIKVPGRSGWNTPRCLERIAEEGAGVMVLLGGDKSASDLFANIDLMKDMKPVAASSPLSNHLALMNSGVGSRILRALGLRKLRIMSSAVKYSAISGYELEVVEYITSPEKGSAPT